MELIDHKANDGGDLQACGDVARPVENIKKPFSFHMSLLALSLLSLITSWDATSLAIALPIITSQLHGTTLESFWASISFILGVAITQPIFVSISNVFGRKQPLYASMILFSIGVIVFATANNMRTLIAGRLIQGLGGGGLDVLEEIIMADITTLKERPLYLGLIAVAIAAGSITGPIVGAVFSEYVDWRWIGWVNLPIIGSSFALAFFFLRLQPIKSSLNQKILRLDWIGMVLYIIGAAATTLPLSWADALYPWSSWRTLVPFFIGLIFLVIFGLYEKRPEEPLLPYRIFSNATSISSLITGFLHGLILYTMLLYLPLFFQAVLLESPLDAGKSTLPVCVLTVAFSFFAPVVIEITRRYRVLLWVGWVITTVFLGLWCLVGETTSRAQVYAFQAMMGVGVGIVFSGTQIPMQASVTHVDDTGLAVGMLVVFRLFGGLVGLAIGSTAFNSAFSKAMETLDMLPREAIGLENASEAIGFIPFMTTSGLTSETLDALVDAYRKAFQAVWIAMTVFSGCGLFASFFIKDLTLESEEVGRQGFDRS